jgi:ribosomal protein L6P/L9E
LENEKKKNTKITNTNLKKHKNIIKYVDIDFNVINFKKTKKEKNKINEKRYIYWQEIKLIINNFNVGLTRMFPSLIQLVNALRSLMIFVKRILLYTI